MAVLAMLPPPSLAHGRVGRHCTLVPWAVTAHGESPVTPGSIRQRSG